MSQLVDLGRGSTVCADDVVAVHPWNNKEDPRDVWVFFPGLVKTLVLLRSGSKVAAYVSAAVVRQRLREPEQVTTS